MNKSALRERLNWWDEAYQRAREGCHPQQGETMRDIVEDALDQIDEMATAYRQIWSGFEKINEGLNDLARAVNQMEVAMLRFHGKEKPPEGG